ncbi:glycosyltransferase [Paenibacillus sp. LMG 31456]|uniref:Glycosyltransferase n=1 Tax=Paenibacillus foliorum TaxID=2654974 RepID=A0A972K312_9BACL|nr:glycosyltransferase family 1 protein [Paenibacillus foliorum]NOU97326.1 glycosyltransferase [Paenibacillus foliorum]
MGGPIRILHVVVNMNRGGAETLLMNLYRNMDRSKVQFDFLTCKEGVFDAEILEMGGVVHRIPYIMDIGHFGYINALDQFFIMNPKYKVVHSHMDKMSGWVLRSAKKAGIPIRIAHSHNTSSEGNAAAKAYKWFAGKLILPSATHLLACSNSAAKWLFADKADAVRVLKNGIECDRFTFSSNIRKQIRKELHLPRNSLVLGHVGRFAPQKNHTFLIDVFAKLNKDKPDSVLVLVGDGPLRISMEKKVAELNLSDKVKFLGIRSDISRLLQAFDVFVFPSVHEGLPVTLIEAQGAGLPCVISDVISQEVDMGIGLVEYYPLIDTVIWVEKIKSIAHRKLPRSISAQALSRNGYDIKNTAELTKDFYLAISR